MKLTNRLRCAIDEFPIITEHPAILLEEAAAYIEFLERQQDALLEASCALGVIGNGYCFCSQDRDPGKLEHEPECRDMRAAIKSVEDL